MTNKILFFTILTFFAVFANAQNLAPNFEEADINGNIHNLYKDYLDKGYTVLLDFSTTWCAPCWGLHQSHIFDSLYIKHGPAGAPGVSANTTDDFMVIQIEDDWKTTFDNLIGIGALTQGDWVTGTPYPIIDKSMGQLGDFTLGGWPTLFNICPDKRFKVLTAWEIYQAAEVQDIGDEPNIENVYDLIMECSQASLDKDAELLNPRSFYTGLCDDQSEGEVELTLHNMGLSDITNALVQVLDPDGNILAETDYTGTLGSFQTEEVVIPVSFSESMELTGKVILADDENPNNDEVVQVGHVATPSSVNVVAEYFTGVFSDSIYYWELSKSDGEVVYTSPLTTESDDTSKIVTMLNLPPNECYSLHFYDNRGYGSYAYTSSVSHGMIGLRFLDGETQNILADFTTSVDQAVGIIVWDDSFIYNETRENIFTTSDMVNSDNVFAETNSVNIFPNPSDGRVTLTHKENITNGLLKVFDVAGTQLFEKKVTGNSYSFDLPDGAYVYHFITEGQIHRGKILVTK